MRRTLLLAGGVALGVAIHALTTSSPTTALNGTLLTATALLPVPAAPGPPIDAQ